MHSSMLYACCVEVQEMQFHIGRDTVTMDPDSVGDGLHQQDERDQDLDADDEGGASKREGMYEDGIWGDDVSNSEATERACVKVAYPVIT